VVVKNEQDKIRVEERFKSEGCPAKVTVSARNLGSVLGPEGDKRAYVEGKAKDIAKHIQCLVDTAPHHPHQVYTVLRLSVLPRVTYLQRTTLAPPEVYQPIEDVMRDIMIPFLLKWDMISEAQSLMVGLPVRDGGLASIDVRIRLLSPSIKPPLKLRPSSSPLSWRASVRLMHTKGRPI